MKQLERLKEPDSFFRGEKKVQFYKDLRDSNGKIRDRWNLTAYQNDLKISLSKISSGECVFCGKYVGDRNFDIEHFLPKEHFPYLSYSFDNYLCSCKYCNQNIKKSFYPKSLDAIKDKLGERILAGEIERIIPYEKNEVLSKTVDRIIEPTFDNISEHLKFEPLSCSYLVINNSFIGKETNRMFFLHREFVKTLQQLSELIYNNIKNGVQREDILEWSKICGYSFYIEELYEYWIDVI